MKNLTVVVLSSILALSGCATYRPIVDMQGVDRAKYDADLAECQRYAHQVDPAGNAAAGVVLGAILGAAMGAAVGDRNFAQRMAGAGAVAGGAQGAGQGGQKQINVIQNCMAGRGYKVLG